MLFIAGVVYFARFVHPFSADTGTSVGDMLGHSKQVNAVTFKPNRPFRIATASEDQLICFYQGPPFKLSKPIEVRSQAKLLTFDNYWQGFYIELSLLDVPIKYQLE